MTASSLLVYLLILSGLILLHEWGHFAVARRSGVRVTDFALGMGPTLLKWTSPRSGTNYRLNLLPIGGYCQMSGEDGKTNEGAQQRAFLDGGGGAADGSFQGKPASRRLAIVLAGPAANFAAAVALLFLGSLAFGVPGGEPTTTVAGVTPGAPAARAGLRAGDRIVSIDGVAMGDGRQLLDVVHGSAGKPLRIAYERAGRVATTTATPALTRTPGASGAEGRLGFSPAANMVRVGPREAALASIAGVADVAGGTAEGLASLATHPAASSAGMQGPIGLARTSAEAQALGPYMLIWFAAAISVSLGIFNLLPIPALDGGRAAFILVEMLRGRPVPPEREAMVHVGGAAVLVALMVAVGFHDVATMAGGPR